MSHKKKCVRIFDGTQSSTVHNRDLSYLLSRLDCINFLNLNKKEEKTVEKESFSENNIKKFQQYTVFKAGFHHFLEGHKSDLASGLSFS